MPYLHVINHSADATGTLDIFVTRVCVYIHIFKPHLRLILKQQLHQQLNTLCNIIVTARGYVGGLHVVYVWQNIFGSSKITDFVT